MCVLLLTRTFFVLLEFSFFFVVSFLFFFGGFVVDRPRTGTAPFVPFFFDPFPVESFTGAFNPMKPSKTR